MNDNNYSAHDNNYNENQRSRNSSFSFSGSPKVLAYLETTINHRRKKGSRDAHSPENNPMLELDDNTSEQMEQSERLVADLSKSIIFLQPDSPQPMDAKAS